MNEVFSIMMVMWLLTETGVTALELQVEVSGVYSRTVISQSLISVLGEVVVQNFKIRAGDSHVTCYVTLSQRAYHFLTRNVCLPVTDKAFFKLSTEYSYISSA